LLWHQLIQKKDQEKKMGVPKQEPSEFLYSFAIIAITMGTSFGGLVMENLFSREKDSAISKEHKKSHAYMIYTGTIASPWAWPFWAGKACLAAGAAIFMTDYDSPGLSHEKVADAYTVLTVYFSALGCLWFLPHLFNLGIIHSRQGRTWTWANVVVMFAMIVNLGLAVTLTALYFKYSRTTAGIISIGWIAELLVLGFWYFFTDRATKANVEISNPSKEAL
jgi:hypothetical protein